MIEDTSAWEGTPRERTTIRWIADGKLQVIDGWVFGLTETLQPICVGREEVVLAALKGDGYGVSTGKALERAGADGALEPDEGPTGGAASSRLARHPRQLAHEAISRRRNLRVSGSPRNGRETPTP